MIDDISLSCQIFSEMVTHFILMHCRDHACHAKQQEDHTNDNTVVTKCLEVVIFDVIHHELNRKQRHNPRNHKAK